MASLKAPIAVKPVAVRFSFSAKRVSPSIGSSPVSKITAKTRSPSCSFNSLVFISGSPARVARGGVVQLLHRRLLVGPGLKERIDRGVPLHLADRLVVHLELHALPGRV